jgi:hypothetical protein
VQAQHQLHLLYTGLSAREPCGIHRWVLFAGTEPWLSILVVATCARSVVDASFSLASPSAIPCSLPGGVCARVYFVAVP